MQTRISTHVALTFCAPRDESRDLSGEASRNEREREREREGEEDRRVLDL